jgi:hypothetical protein
MPHSVFPSKSVLSGTILLLFSAMLMESCILGHSARVSKYSSFVIQPYSKTDKQDTKWADYLFAHLSRRASDGQLIAKTDARSDGRIVRVDLDSTFKGDCQWYSENNQIVLRARNEKRMLWLIYQFISELGATDDRIAVDDLSPAIVSFEDNGSLSFPFEYSSIYSPSNRNTDMMPILGVGNIDYDWGLWEHNLHKALGTNLPAEARAYVNGKRDTTQYCFSSNVLYQRLVEFILDQYGDGTKDGGSRFVIMPNDNPLVCQCALCRQKGNTATSATPAVTSLIARLARRFPAHTFFMSSYLSVKEPPASPMPANVGVIVSAIDVPLKYNIMTETPGKRFEQLLAKWKRVVNRIYIWDYMRNFDDYLSPFPQLSVMQQRFQWYQKLGVKGIVLNGSGEDYASFDDMQTFALASLMARPQAGVDELVKSWLAKFYPHTGQQIADYYLNLEKRVVDHRYTLPFYGGILDEMETYLPSDEFYSFFKSLDAASKKVTGSERQQLNRLLSGFNFTLLEMMRTPKTDFNFELWDGCLEDLFGTVKAKAMFNYREAFGSLEDYISYQSVYKPYVGKSDGLSCTSHPALTDGYLGIPYDYHTNWLISPEAVRTFALQLQQTGGKLSVGCMQAATWHIYAPQKIELWQKGRLLEKAVSPSEAIPSRENPFCRLSYTLPTRKLTPGSFEIKIYAPTLEGKVTTACDEVQYQ